VSGQPKGRLRAMDMDGLPAYRELPAVPGLRARMSWNVFGRDDRYGTLNLLTNDRVRAAAALVSKGKVFSLNWELELPNPPMFGRRPLRHTTTASRNGTDDYYDSFFPQASSQWDALSHIGHPVAGFYGGHSASAVADPATNPLGIEWWGRRGIAGRFVLVDVAGSRAARGRPLDATAPEAIEVDEVEAILHAEKVALQGGDILLFRFGWIAWYEAAEQSVRDRIARLGHAPTPGLAQGEDMAAWLWDQRVAAVVGDNPGVERYPADPSDLESFLHYRLIAFLGMAIGELFVLDALAEDCAADGTYEGLFMAAPLNKRGGSGSTSNALAVK
jgi:kynurenine formamidase